MERHLFRPGIESPDLCNTCGLSQKASQYDIDEFIHTNWDARMTITLPFSPEDIIRTASGATSSKCPRFDLLPFDGLTRIASRFELGLEKHGKDNWRKGIGNAPYAIERLNHIIKHSKRLIEKLEGRTIPNMTDDDAGAIGWGGIFICEWMSDYEKEIK